MGTFFSAIDVEDVTHISSPWPQLANRASRRLIDALWSSLRRVSTFVWGQNLHKKQSHRLPGRNSAANQRPLGWPNPPHTPPAPWGCQPNQRSQSGGHWDVTHRAASPKILCVSPRPCWVVSVWRRHRPVCEEVSFFIRSTLYSRFGSFFFDLSACRPVTKCGLDPFMDTVASLCAYVRLLSFSPLLHYLPNFRIPGGVHCWGLCTCSIALSNWTSPWNKQAHNHTQTHIHVHASPNYLCVLIRLS